VDNGEGAGAVGQRPGASHPVRKPGVCAVSRAKWWVAVMFWIFTRCSP
jgi:hypothetical protein